VRPSIVNDPLRTIFDEEFEKLQRLFIIWCRVVSKRNIPSSNNSLLAHLVYLPPLFCRLFCEPFVDQRHDLVEQLTIVTRSAADCIVSWWQRRVDRLVMRAIGDFLHQSRGCAPRFVVCGFSDLNGCFVGKPTQHRKKNLKNNKPWTPFPCSS
jgi:hypothetical protein